jgi:hypothetical protein
MARHLSLMTPEILVGLLAGSALVVLGTPLGSSLPPPLSAFSPGCTAYIWETGLMLVRFVRTAVWAKPAFAYGVSRPIQPHIT